MKFNKLSQTILTAALATIPFTAIAADSSTPDAAKVAEKVRKELVTLPFYGVFDNLAFELNDGTVILNGAVTRPTLKSSAERVAQRVNGVKSVVNRIEVLPLSNFDDGIRLRVLRSVYGQPALQRYQLGAQPSIRILVKNGEVTLEGVVLNEMERNIANIQANAVFGVFKVNNNLRVEKPSTPKA
jgi:hyperosmotically inducible protein